MHARGLQTIALRTSVALLAAAACLALAWPPSHDISAAGPSMQFMLPQPAVPLVNRQVCSLLDKGTGNGAMITGQDEISSLQSGGVVYWGFGDTGLSGGHPQIPNNIATTTDGDAGDCVALTHAQTGGVARPLLPVSGDPDEATVWPTTMVAAVPGQVHFFYASMTVAQKPFAVRFVGLARFDTSTLVGVRTGPNPVLGSSFWPPSYGITGARALEQGEDVYVFLQSADVARQVRLARVPKAQIEDVASYTYWDGTAQAFTPDFGTASTIVSEPWAQMPSEVSWNAYVGKWTMVYTTALGRKLAIRTADQLTGPWSGPRTLFDCQGLYRGPGALGTYCYSGQEHDEFQAAGGETIYATVSNEIDYRVFLHEIRLASPVRQHVLADGRRSYVVEGQPVPPDAGAAEGVAFYSGRSAGAPLSPIHRWVSGADVQYAPSSPGAGFADEGVAFHAPLAPTMSYTPLSPGLGPSARTLYEPVYRWDSADVPTRHVYSQFAAVAGYTRGPVAFYAPCPDSDGDGASDCIESAQGSDPWDVDTDGDGHSDLSPSGHGAGSASNLAIDNCPLAANPDQHNADSDLIDLSVYGKLYNDTTWPNSDGAGDACDPDADNDGLSNAAEAELPGPACPSATGPTAPLLRDTDGDLVLDGAECALGTDPLDAVSRPPAQPADDSDRDGLSDAFEQTIGTDPYRPDTDGDGLLDGVEVKGYGTSPLRVNSDGDRCTDGKEVASINTDANVNSLDLLQVAKSYGFAGSANYVPNMDINKDGRVNSTDMFVAYRQWGYCR